MPEVIRNGSIVSDNWVFVGLDEAHDAASPLPEGPIAVPLATWSARRDELLRRRTPLGVWLAPSDDPDSIRDAFDILSLVAVRFPKFTDGRGYSTAVLLRRAGYRGELRAFGDLGRDQLFYLARVGFDAFALREREGLSSAVQSLKTFREVYQSSVDQPAPLFRRRQPAGTVQ